MFIHIALTVGSITPRGQEEMRKHAQSDLNLDKETTNYHEKRGFSEISAQCWQTRNKCSVNICVMAGSQSCCCFIGVEPECGWML